jgi:ATP-dependent DNA helicase RecQ
MSNLRSQAERWLEDVLGKNIGFREGQWEAIDALVRQRQRVLVVQRTGWGKSLVYFMASRLLRSQGAGLTLIISPLLSLMRNQLDTAKQWGLKAASIDSTNSDRHSDIERAVLANKLDVLFISPERLGNDRFQEKVWGQLSQNLGLMVIDEVHCISDWGHDFRPNYRRIMSLLDALPVRTPVLGTTATANNRVVADVAEIIGATMNIQRGALTRDSLLLYVYSEPLDVPTRLTLLSHLLKNIQGSGIIYCTTTRDCQVVADWLHAEGFPVKAYYADVESQGNESRADLEQQLMKNKVKALVSSVALGMGFDKSDLHFVIHYQLPSNLINYYQQIGRAGRGVDKAHIVLMHGDGDEDIQEYFIDSAFPSPRQVDETLLALRHHQGRSRFELEAYVNVRRAVLEKILIHLEVEGIIEKRESGYFLLRPNTTPDYERWEGITKMRYQELEQMKAYLSTDKCLMRFIAESLDDAQPKDCGKCKNCRQQSSKFTPDMAAVERASKFLRQGNPIFLQPRKQYPMRLEGRKRTTIVLQNETGIALSNYYEAGWGMLVRLGREKNRYAEDLVEASAEMLQDYWKAGNPRPKILVPVPSLRRPTLVSEFAQRLAAILKLPLVPALKHVNQHKPQNEMRNSKQQVQNLVGAFEVVVPVIGASILLVDDIADSKWTLTVLGELLQEKGSGAVYPFVLATMSNAD